MRSVDESVIEQAALAWLEALGYTILSGPEIAPGEPEAERKDYEQVILESRLRQALQRLNPQVPADALEEAFRKLTRPDMPSLVANNHLIHKYLVDGVPVEYQRADLPAPRPGCFFVYAIRCDDESIYIGQTENLERRWRKHLAGTAAEHTRKHRPVRIEHYEEHESRERAVEREKWLKSGIWSDMAETRDRYRTGAAGRRLHRRRPRSRAGL